MAKLRGDKARVFMYEGRSEWGDAKSAKKLADSGDLTQLLMSAKDFCGHYGISPTEFQLEVESGRIGLYLTQAGRNGERDMLIRGDDAVQWIARRQKGPRIH